MEATNTKIVSAETVPRQDFYIWLKTVPLGVLYSLYTQYYKRKYPSSSGIPLEENTISQTIVPKEKIILRRSVFILIFALINIEILFDGLYILLKLPVMYFSLPALIQLKLTSLYFLIFIGINILKFAFILLVCLRWVTTTYEIKSNEIKFKKGLLALNQKVFLCKHTQEVICKQGVVGKIFNFGSIEIYDPTLIDRITIDSIQNPNKYADIIKRNFLVSNDLEFMPPINQIQAIQNSLPNN